MKHTPGSRSGDWELLAVVSLANGIALNADVKIRIGDVVVTRATPSSPMVKPSLVKALFPGSWRKGFLIQADKVCGQPMTIGRLHEIHPHSHTNQVWYLWRKRRVYKPSIFAEEIPLP